MEENHNHISHELAIIRFGGETLHLDNEVNYSDLPDELFEQIETFIKTEIPDVDDDPDEIVEVPVPPKPVPEVVNLENDEEKNSVISPAVTVAVMAPNENHSPSSSTSTAVPNPHFSMLETLQTLNEEENDLFEQQQQVMERLQQIMERLDYIRQLRSQVLSNK